MAPMEQNSAEELRPCSAMEFDRIRSSSCLLADTSVTKLVVAVWTRGVATAAVRESAAGQVGYLVAGSEASATSKNSRHQVARSSAPAIVTSVSLSKDSCTKIAAAAFSPATASVCHMARCCSESPPW